MPLVKVNLLKGRSAEEGARSPPRFSTALVSTLEVPDADRYQLFNEYDGESFRHTSGYLGMTYTDQLLIIEITFLEGRDDEVKKSLLAEINRNLVAAGVVGGDDVFDPDHRDRPRQCLLRQGACPAGSDLSVGRLNPPHATPVITGNGLWGTDVDRPRTWLQPICSAATCLSTA
mgnify:CR=1 FL=1